MSIGVKSAHRVGLTVSALVHLGLALSVVVMAIGRTAEPVPLVYAVELVAAPAPTAKPPRRAASEAVATAPEQNVAPVDPPRRRPPAPDPAPPPPPEQVQRTDRAIVTKAPVEPLPGETPGVGRDIANVRLTGVAFQYPEYLKNIVSQVLRRWQQPTGQVNLTAEVAFTILRDGTVTEIQFLRRSGSFAFDLAAQGAIEAAAESGGFGPLPSGFNGVSLPIAFLFEPRAR
ncbi:MAG: TonB C-terminal domain-containing protein [Gemmatimonadales bacterium]|nr:TonB C-terminal domain-containing protein [Gemmatimonadales bacterium]MDZ4389823.1 TonB C-terminal domain-containing protein [Gemmatimonadales bacterium]